VEIVLTGVAFAFGGYLAGRLTAASGTALALGAVALVALLAVPLALGQPWYVLTIAIGFVPGYVRGRRRAARRQRIITLPRFGSVSTSQQVAPSVRQPTQRAGQESQA
jgi:hypothetical protein